ncbi:hypothetical protein DFA_10921 [Cavenderia fasciculata]|uniref:Uncharacterized protein n=1 Tax=Cavenderia fasciculata TaxID=261658 RepID=F4QBS5_CACFS|nr:uncharacterized protein DFA_10921 [Cavenderia fasciculata]EGG14663.1 hypothetical protein DFA_10921 [Cavenderia fasciculata]|eukprot:XP_004351171.1 hypothetical protein DFA_10921 [Cavenderia fasciculata]
MGVLFCFGLCLGLSLLDYQKKNQAHIGGSSSSSITYYSSADSYQCVRSNSYSSYTTQSIASNTSTLKSPSSTTSTTSSSSINNNKKKRGGININSQNNQNNQNNQNINKLTISQKHLTDATKEELSTDPSPSSLDEKTGVSSHYAYLSDQHFRDLYLFQDGITINAKKLCFDIDHSGNFQGPTALRRLGRWIGSLPYFDQSCFLYILKTLADKKAYQFFQDLERGLSTLAHSTTPKRH